MHYPPGFRHAICKDTTFALTPSALAPISACTFQLSFQVIVAKPPTNTHELQLTVPAAHVLELEDCLTDAVVLGEAPPPRCATPVDLKAVIRIGRIGTGD